MIENNSGILTFPTRDRLQRKNAGSIMYFLIGIILILIGYLSNDPIFYLIAAPLTIVGILANGYRKIVQIDQTMGKVRFYRGFYFFIKRNDYQFSSFNKIIVRKTSSLSTRFPIGGYVRTMDSSYKLFIAGNNEVEVESTQEEELAKQWGEQISNILNLKVHFEEDKEFKKEAKSKEPVLLLISIIILLLILCFMAFILYQVFNIE